ncbi:MAG: heme-binding protein [Bacteroidota bacterium]
MKQLIMAAVLMVLVCVSFFAVPANAQLVTKKVLTLDAAKKLASAAEAEASKNKWTMVITVVDDGGNLMYLEKIDNTQIGSIEVAIQKAKTAILFKRPTKVFEDKIIKEGRTAILSLPNAIAIEGGLPIVVDGQYVGAIGISGGSSDQDGVVAKAAVDKFSGQ